MRAAFLCLLLATSASAADDSNRQTANEFLLGCKLALRAADGEALQTVQQLSSATYCTAYLHGIRDALATQYVGHGGVILCSPPGVTSTQLARVFVKFAEAHPERLHEDALNIALAAIFTAFPCGPETSA